MGYTCCVPGCYNLNRGTIHRFPKGNDRWKTWVKLINRPDLMNRQKNLDSYRLCYIHFERTMYHNRGLISNAIPTLKLPKIVVRDIETQTESINFGDNGELVQFLLPGSSNIMVGTASTYIPDPAPETLKTVNPSSIFMRIQLNKYGLSSIFIQDKDMNITNIIKEEGTQTDNNYQIKHKDYSEIMERQTDSGFQLLSVDVNGSIKTGSSTTAPESQNKDQDLIEDNEFEELENEIANIVTSGLKLHKKMKPTGAGEQTTKIFCDDIDQETEIFGDEINQETEMFGDESNRSIEYFGDEINQGTKMFGDEINQDNEILGEEIIQETETFGEEINQEILGDEVDASELLDSTFKKEFFKMKELLMKPGQDYNYFEKFRLYCLNLYCSAPKAYKLFQKCFNLPSEKKLFSTKLNVPPGINENFITLVSKQLKKMPSNAKFVTLYLDEIAISEHIYYDIRNDIIVGYHDVNAVKSLETAHTAIIMRIKCCFQSYEQLIGYGLFGGNHYDYKSISDWLDNTVRLLYTVGFEVCVVVSKQTSIVNKLAEVKGITYDDPFFIVDNKTIFFMFDMPHLISSLRTEFLTCNFFFDDYKSASWEYVTTFFNNQSLRSIKLAPKLTPAHIEPTPSQCKSLKMTKEVFSYTVAAGIAADIESGLQPSGASGTADFIMKINDLYDIFSSTRAKNTHKNKKPYTGSDYQNKCLIDAYTTFLGMRVFDSVTGLEKNQINCIEGILISIKALLQLHKYFVAAGIKTFYTKKLHQNSKKLLSEILGQQNTANKTPSLTPIQFKRCFSKLALKQLLNCPRLLNDKKYLDSVLLINNCEYGETDFSLLVEYLPNVPKMSPLCVDTIDYRNEKTFKDLTQYLLDKCTMVHECDAFKEYAAIKTRIVEQKETDTLNIYAIVPMPNGDNSMPQDFIEYLKQCRMFFRDEFDSASLHKHVAFSLLEKLKMAVSPIQPCPCFPLGYLNKLFLRWSIYKSLKLKNKTLKHLRLQRSDTIVIP